MYFFGKHNIFLNFFSLFSFSLVKFETIVLSFFINGQNLLLIGMNTQKTQILLVDDHFILLDGLSNILNENGFYVAAKANSVEMAMKMLGQHKIDLVLTDIQMPGEDGIELVKKIKKSYPDVKVVVLSMHCERSIVLDALQHKIDGYLLKNISEPQMVKALKIVMLGKFYVSEEISHLLVERFHSDQDTRLLSKRETEVLKLVAKEYSNKEIATTLFISERTVESHRKNIFRKTNTHSVVGLIKYAMENKLI